MKTQLSVLFIVQYDDVSMTHEFLCMYFCILDKNLVLSSFMTYHRMCNTMGARCGAGTDYPSGAPEFTWFSVG
jgi:hypothetical protein